MNTCDKIYRQRHYAKHKAEINEYSKKYYQTNKNKRIELEIENKKLTDEITELKETVVQNLSEVISNSYKNNTYNLCWKLICEANDKLKKENSESKNIIRELLKIYDGLGNFSGGVFERAKDFLNTED